MDNIKLHIGEERFIKMKVGHSSNKTFIITDAKYKLQKNGVIHASGSMNIENHTLTALISAKEKGLYSLKVFVTIPPETIIHKVCVQVV